MRKSGAAQKGGPLMLQRKTIVQKTVEAESSPVDNESVTIRKDFPESWIFDIIDGDELE